MDIMEIMDIVGIVGMWTKRRVRLFNKRSAN